MDYMSDVFYLDDSTQPTDSLKLKEAFESGKPVIKLPGRELHFPKIDDNDETFGKYTNEDFPWNPNRPFIPSNRTIVGVKGITRINQLDIRQPVLEAKSSQGNYNLIGFKGTHNAGKHD